MAHFGKIFTRNQILTLILNPGLQKAAHLSQDVSSAGPPVDAGLAEPPLLLLHHQRVRPTWSSRQLLHKSTSVNLIPLLLVNFELNSTCLVSGEWWWCLAEAALSGLLPPPLVWKDLVRPATTKSCMGAILRNPISATTPPVLPMTNRQMNVIICTSTSIIVSADSPCPRRSPRC